MTLFFISSLDVICPIYILLSFLFFILIAQIMKANKYFDIKELVPKEVYYKYRDDCIKLFDPRAIKVLENVREILGVPLICNNWAAGGFRNNSGFREPNSPVGVKNSFHKKGMAFDLTSKYMTAKEMREKLEKEQDKLIQPIRVEKWEGDKEITWLHIDISPNTHGKKIYFFKA